MAVSTAQAAPTSGVNRPYKGKSPLRMAIRRYLHNPMAVAGTVMLLAILVVTVGAPLFTHYSPSAMDIMNTDAAPSALHPLGTDANGYDNLARLLYGGRADLTVAVLAAFMSMVIGTLYGGVAGFFGGWIDNLLMRFVDVMLNFPFIALVISLQAIFNTQSMFLLVFVVGITAWPGPARMMRGVFLQLKEQDFVVGATTIGARRTRIIFRHMLPNTVSTLIVLVSFSVASYVGLEAALSFIGLGLPPSVPDWGVMLSQHSDFISLTTKPWTWIPPMMMIVLTILSVNFIGDGLRDAFDPQTRS